MACVFLWSCVIYSVAVLLNFEKWAYAHACWRINEWNIVFERVVLLWNQKRVIENRRCVARAYFFSFHKWIVNIFHCVRIIPDINHFSWYRAKLIIFDVSSRTTWVGFQSMWYTSSLLCIQRDLHYDWKSSTVISLVALIVRRCFIKFCP